MNFRRTAFWIALLQIPLTLPAAGPVPANGPMPLSGDARGFGGGDPLDPRLHDVRADLARALKLIRETKSLESLCTVGTCPAELAPAQCEAVRRLDQAQAGECRAFLKSMAVQFEKRNPLFAYEITDAPLTVADGNSHRPVAAMTKIGPQGPVRFNRSGIEPLSRDELTALIAHELGHKTDRKGFLTDTQIVSGFDTGRNFLDAVGIALALFAASVRIPAQAPPELAKGISPSAFCSASLSSSPFRAGMAADVLGKLDKIPEGKDASDLDRIETASRFLASPEARAHHLAAWFQKYLSRMPSEDESMALVLQMSHGANSPAMVAAILRNEEYTNSRRLADATAFVTAIHRDVLGRGPTAEELKTQLKQLALVGKSDFLIQWLQQNESVLTELSRGWYQRLLNRTPWEAESRRSTAQLKTGMDWEELQTSILASPEYAALQKVRAGSCPSRTLSSQ